MSFKLGGTEINSGFVASSYDEVIPPLATREPWVRPSSWIDIPANPNGDDVFYGILPVYDTDQEVVIMTFDFGTNGDTGGSVDVDWGDGNTETVTASNQNGASVIHKFNFSDISSNTTTTVFGRSCRQALVKVTLTASSNPLYAIYLNSQAEARRRGSGDFYAVHYSKWIDMYLNWSGIRYFTVGYSNQRNSIAKYLHKLTIEDNSLYRLLLSGSTALRQLSFQDNGTLTSLNRTFHGCQNLTQLPTLDTSNVTDFDYAINGCRLINQAPDWDTSSGTTFQGTFSHTDISDFPQYDFSSATNLSSCFSSNYRLRKILVPDAPNCTNFSSLFSDCKSLGAVKFTSATSGVTNFSHCFSGCENLRLVRNLDTSSATSISNIFYACQSLRRIPKLNTDNVTNFNSAFRSCLLLQRVELTSVANATSLQESFAGSKNIKEIKIDNLNSTGVTSLYGTFSGCTSLEYLPEIDTSNVTTFNYSTLNLSNLKAFPNWDYSKATSATNLFTMSNHLYNYHIEEIPDFILPSALSVPVFSNYRSVKKIGNLDFRRATRNPNFYGLSNVEEWGYLNVSGCTNPSYMFYGANTSTVPMLILNSGTVMGPWLRSQNVREIPAWNLSGVVINTCFENMSHLDSFKPTLINTNISFNNSTLMASGAIDQVAEALESGVNGTAGFTNVDIYSNQISLMNSKGWTVTT